MSHWLKVSFIKIQQHASYESQISELEHEALAKRDIHITEETFNDLTAQFL